MKKPTPTDILKRYIDNSCTPEERKLVLDWYESVSAEDDFVSTFTEQDESELEEKIYLQIINRIETAETDASINRKKGIYRKIAYVATAMAAMLIIYFSVLPNLKSSKFSALKAADKVQLLTVRNTTKQIYKAILPDNSTIWLNPGAVITYPEKFNANYRMITFSGESFFEITKALKRLRLSLDQYYHLIILLIIKIIF